METILVVSSLLLWVMVLLNLLLTLGLARRVRAAFPKMEMLKVGQQAPDFTAQTLQGENISLAHYAGKAVAFIFISPDCKPCLDELPRLEGLRPKARQFGAELVLVSDANATKTQSLVEEHRLDLPILIAPRENNPFFVDYKAMGAPFYCLVDAQGKVQANGMSLFDLERKMEARETKGGDERGK
ncbi:MAG: peroxiredoxin family protein [Chloroflexi bacterium]|nr:peroxiredoxin family protein [Chloroflexota bacterium]